MSLSYGSDSEHVYGTVIQPVPASSFSNHMVRSCASCHGAERQGGIRMMPFFWVKSPALTRQALFAKADLDDGHGDHESYNATSLAKVIRQGTDPSGEALDSSMPRWRLSDTDMKDLTDYLLQ